MALQEDNIELTPEQQRQLAMIEGMPLTVEKEITQEEWDLKTPEEKERIIGGWYYKLVSLASWLFG